MLVLLVEKIKLITYFFFSSPLIIQLILYLSKYSCVVASYALYPTIIHKEIRILTWIQTMFMHVVTSHKT